MYCCKIKQSKYRKVFKYAMYVPIQTIELSMFYLLAGQHKMALEKEGGGVKKFDVFQNLIPFDTLFST